MRILEKGIVKKLNSIDFENDTELYGFRAGKSTHDAFEVVQEACKNKKPVVLIDLAKAYNSVSREQVMNRLKPKLDEVDHDILHQIVNKQTVKVMDRYMRTDKGLPQGSALSPVLFNHAFDEVVSEIKRRLPDTQTVAYADDTAVIGTNRADIIEEILGKFGLTVNRKKSAILNGDCKGYPSRKTYKYLGSRLKSDGQVIGATPLIRKIRDKAVKCSMFGKANPSKALQLTLSVVGAMINFHKERTEKIGPRLLISIKTALQLPRGLKIETIRKAILAWTKKDSS